MEGERARHVDVDARAQPLLGLHVVVELVHEDLRCLFEQQEGAQHFVIALGGLARITGPGLRVLVALARSLPRAGGSLVLCELQRTVEEALQVSALDRVFELAPDRAAALRRSRDLQSGTRPINPAAGEEKIAYAIELLGGSGPTPAD